VSKHAAPVADRLKVYRLVRAAVEEGRFESASRFIEENRNCGYAMPCRQTIRNWSLGVRSPYFGKRLFDGRPSEELSFFLGAWMGDGWADESDGGKRLLLKVRSYDFAKEFADCAAKVLGKKDSYWVRRITGEKGKWYLVKVSSFELFGFVNKSIGSLKDVVRQFPRGFLRGLFTAEGNPSVSLESRFPSRLGIGVCVSNSDYELLTFSKELLLTEGLRPGKIRLSTRKGKRTTYGIARKNVWTMTLSRFSDVKGFETTIGFADSEKTRKLDDAISMISDMGSHLAAAEWQSRYEKKSGDWRRKSASIASQ
jgi:intein-encoded DNA endonuclease-like protein